MFLNNLSYYLPEFSLNSISINSLGPKLSCSRLGANLRGGMNRWLAAPFSVNNETLEFDISIVLTCKRGKLVVSLETVFVLSSIPLYRKRTPIPARL